jgi:hypothetical protein
MIPTVATPVPLSFEREALGVLAQFTRLGRGLKRGLCNPYREAATNANDCDSERGHRKGV